MTVSLIDEVPELPAKLLSPEYVAVTVCEPIVVEVSEQLVTGKVATHEAPAPSLTVTVPVGVPLPGATTTTLNVTVVGWPTATELGEIETTVVVVTAFTLSAALPELPLKLLSPE